MTLEHQCTKMVVVHLQGSNKSDEAEVFVLKRIQELHKEGMWYDFRLAKCHEPSPTIAHWDYLLQEVAGMYKIFFYEHKLKIILAKKCSQMIKKYFQDRSLAITRAKKEEELRKRRNFTLLIKEMKTFWVNAKKLVEMSEKSRIDVLRKKALDVQLGLIVKQTEKYSNMLSETLSTSAANNTIDSTEESDHSPHYHCFKEDVLKTADPDGDDDFEPTGSEEDDEETISKAEEEAAENKVAVDKEVKLLAEESEIPMEDLLDTLPKGYLDWRLQKCDNTSDDDMDIDRSVSAETFPGKSDEVSNAGEDYEETSTSESESDSEFESAVENLSTGSSRNSSTSNSDSEFEDAFSSPLAVTFRGPTQLTFSSCDKKAAANVKLYVNESNLNEEETKAQIKSQEDGKLETDANTRGKITLRLRLDKQTKTYKNIEKDSGVLKQKDDTRKVATSEIGSKDEGYFQKECEKEEMSSSESEDYNSNDSENEVVTNEDEDPDQTTGLASLLQTFAPERAGEDHEDHINSVAAEAESFQPKGYTLSSTTVSTKVPFLLKYTLREYQHIGLDWLVAMHTNKFNGILADEMGLGKTIQTIALLAHLACEKENWGPHLIVVPTSVMINWEMEFKKWCPGLKILTYYGSSKERKLKRQGWTKPNSFHVCITSYKLVVQDHHSFRRKKWKYLILDEAQNIKNFKSQRWQLLLNFQTQRRLLLTGTPLQNNLMELWSLMHFLMPNVFQSHREFREWFSDPLSHMVEGNSSYDNNIIKRLHKVLRPFLLRRLKSEVEKQLPQKHSHVIFCRLSKRQRYLYEEYMERSNTKDTLNKGNLLSVLGVLMQLRKVCNHPNLFESRAIISPFQAVAIPCTTPFLVWNILDEHILYSSPTFSIFKMTEADLVLSKEDGRQIWARRWGTQNELDNPENRMEIENSNGVEKMGSHVLKTHLLESMEIDKRQFKKVKREPPPIPVLEQGVPFFMALDTNRKLHNADLENVTAKKLILGMPLNQKPDDLTSVMKASPTKVKNNFEHVDNAKNGQDSGLSETNYTNVSSADNEKSPKNETQTLHLHNSNSSLLKMSKFGASNMTQQKLQMAKAKYKAYSYFMEHLKTQAAIVETSKRKSNLTMRKVVKPWLESIGYPNIDNFITAEMQERKLKDRRDLIARIQTINEERCKIMPVIGSRTKEVCQIFDIAQCGTLIERRRGPKSVYNRNDKNLEGLFHLGYTEMRMTMFLKTCSSPTIANNLHSFWRTTKGLMNLTWTLKEQLSMFSEIIKRFVIYVPAVCVPNPFASFFRPTAAYYARQKQWDRDLKHNFRKPVEILHPILSRMSTQFPDSRLIEYDCGKLQVLNRLLRALKAEDHRVLIFTQMSKMLDVLEAFLNYHGHIYLRLDGATKIETRQILMQRFNSDKRIFCFILSTRSGGIGVNLTGADTVIFYDSDWNPTMDAQAQDRCHRIGQTRDVNIYRLISERTIEENILKKSNQKRILGELAIEGGNFTTAYFKKDSIFDLFNVDSFESNPLQRIRNDVESSSSVMNASDAFTCKTKGNLDVEATVLDDQQTIQLFEQALAEGEDETDVQAARTAQAEVASELAEFDEENEDNHNQKTDVEMAIISAVLMPVERYALRFMEHYIDEWSRETVSNAKMEIENQNREWEIEQLRKTEAERMANESPKEENKVLMDPNNKVSNKSWPDHQVAKQCIQNSDDCEKKITIHAKKSRTTSSPPPTCRRTGIPLRMLNKTSNVFKRKQNTRKNVAKSKVPVRLTVKKTHTAKSPTINKVKVEVGRTQSGRRTSVSTSTPPPSPIPATPPTPRILIKASPSTTEVKRGRGRPRKYFSSSQEK